MKKENILYKHVYDSLVSQIYKGSYRYGEYLPSFERLCGEFGVSNITIRKAVHMLVAGRYVEMTRSKRFRIVFDITSPAYESDCLAQLAARKKAILETFEMMQAMMPLFFSKGADLCGEAEYLELSGILERINPWTQPLSEIAETAAAFMMYVPKRLKNPVLTDLLRTANQFIMVSHLPGLDQPYPFARPYMELRPHFRRLLGLIRQRTQEKIRESVCGFYVKGGALARNYMEAVTGNLQPSGEDRFCWNINGASPYLSLELVDALMERIEEGAYRDGEYLPVPAVLAGQFEVAEPVVRRSLLVMNRVGVVKTVNGKGTRVCLEEGTLAGLEDAPVREVLRLGVYSAQLLLIVCPEITRLCMPEWNGLPVAGKTGPVPWALGGIARRLPNPVMKAVCRQLELAALAAYRVALRGLEGGRPQVLNQCEQAAWLLGGSAREALDERLRALYLGTYRFLRERLIGWGIAEERELIRLEAAKPV